jgi:hypothetical protein
MDDEPPHGWLRKSPQAELEDSKTERAAIRGWGSTLRLLVLRRPKLVAATTILVVLGILNPELLYSLLSHGVTVRL